MYVSSSGLVPLLIAAELLVSQECERPSVDIFLFNRDQKILWESVLYFEYVICRPIDVSVLVAFSSSP